VRLLVITPKVDPDDDLFGHVATWMAALARRVDRLYVIALWDTRPPLPANVRLATLGKGATEDKAFWLARLQRYLARLCLEGEVDAVLAHMGPVFAVAAAPIARLAGVPLCLWYAHGHVSPMLRLAHRLVDGIGTSTPEGFRIPSAKVTVTGQGIDTARFVPAVGNGIEGPILSVGRFSPIKDYETLLDAIALLTPASGTSDDAHTFELIGGSHSEAERRYFADLLARADRLEIRERVKLVPGLPHAEIVPRYQRASLFVSCSRTGSLDKAVLEAAACGVVPLVCSSAFRGLFGERWDELSFPPGDAPVLARRMADWLGRGEAERRAVGSELRAVVERSHSVDHLADAIVAMIELRL
jgi:glycosyltransferase involved in cell wall biosynthesis